MTASNLRLPDALCLHFAWKMFVLLITLEVEGVYFFHFQSCDIQHVLKLITPRSSYGFGSVSPPWYKKLWSSHSMLTIENRSLDTCKTVFLWTCELHITFESRWMYRLDLNNPKLLFLLIERLEMTSHRFSLLAFQCNLTEGFGLCTSETSMLCCKWDRKSFRNANTEKY